jgi:AraC family transcriptional regulator
MVLQEFPNLDWLKREVNQQFSSGKGWDGRVLHHPGWPSVILNVKAQNIYRDNIRGPVSLFSNISGTSRVAVNGRDTLIQPGYFFVSNAGQEYNLEIEKLQTETFNIHFGDHFISAAYESLSPLNLDPSQQAQPFEFKNRLLPFDDQAKILMKRLNENQVGGLDEEEILFGLFEHLVSQEKEVVQRSYHLPSLKKSTRDEVMNRILRAVDYAYSFSDQNISLGELAEAACLSKFHFLRLFKATFHKTPHQFVNEVRVERAKDYLTNSKLTVQEIARQTGFDSSSSFSRMFYHRVGVYPSQFAAFK